MCTPESEWRAGTRGGSPKYHHCVCADTCLSAYSLKHQRRLGEGQWPACGHLGSISKPYISTLSVIRCKEQWFKECAHECTVTLPSQEFTKILLKKKELALGVFRHQTKEQIITQADSVHSLHDLWVLSSLCDILSPHTWWSCNRTAFPSAKILRLWNRELNFLPCRDNENEMEPHCIVSHWDLEGLFVFNL